MARVVIQRMLGNSLTTLGWDTGSLNCMEMGIVSLYGCGLFVHLGYSGIPLIRPPPPNLRLPP